MYGSTGSTEGLVGRVLTLIDASVPEGTQCEALKSIVKRELWDEASNRYGDGFPINISEKLEAVLQQVTVSGEPSPEGTYEGNQLTVPGGRTVIQALTDLLTN